MKNNNIELMGLEVVGLNESIAVYGGYSETIGDIAEAIGTGIGASIKLFWRFLKSSSAVLCEQARNGDLTVHK